MRWSPLQGLTIKASLVVGFVLTVAVWVYTGYDFAARMAQVEERSAEITARYMLAQEQLAGVRAQLLSASVYVRDALLDPNPEALRLYRRQLDENYTSIDRALEGYQPILGTDAERRQVNRLRQEVMEFRLTTGRVLQARTDNQSADARQLLNKEVVPRREAAIRVSEEVQALNRSAFVQHQTDIGALHRRAERQTWQQLGLALLVSIGIGLIASLYAGRLETRLRRQMATNERNARDVQRLSTRLIIAQEQERRTIARELHDEVGQVLTAVKVELSVAQRTLETAGWPSRLLNDAQTIADSALHSVRDLSQLLHPALLDDLGLAAAVEWQASAFSKRHGIKVDVRHDGMAKRLAPAVELAAYRIVQEALTNVAKHAAATACRVALRRTEQDLEISVQDDGIGFDPTDLERGDGRGLGLVGMHERAAQFAGRVALQTARGEGTEVKVRLPLRETELTGG
jgi:signal transduction histidine kinase